MRSRGFTLIELLVVIAIIALLLSILMPALSKVKAQARGVVCRSNLKQWGVITALYAQDNEDKLYQSVAGGSLNAEDAYWIVASLPYYGDRDIRLCPSTKVINRDPAYNYGSTREAWGPLYGSTWMEAFSTGSYGINEWASAPPSDAADIWGFDVSWTWRKTTAGEASDVPVFLDCAFVDGFSLDDNFAPVSRDDQNGWGNHAIKLYCLDRHNQAVNAVFLDGSARKVLIKNLWKLKWHREFDIKASYYYTGEKEWPDWMKSFRE